MPDVLLRQALLLIEPLGFTWGCLVVAALVFLWRRRWRAASFSSALCGFLYVFGATDVPGAMLRSLERPYAGMDPAALPEADAVVLLGGGAQPSRLEVAGVHLTPAGDRLFMGAHVMRLRKAPVLVLGGGAAKLDGAWQVEADLVQKWFHDWRILGSAEEEAPRVISLGRCRHTYDEAVKVRALAEQQGWRRILLVTSASHMRRAMATFQAQGLEVVPAACNFMTTLGTAASPGGFTVPRHEMLAKVSIWLHEQIGYLEYWRRGWIGGAPRPPIPPQIKSHLLQQPVIGTFSIVARDAQTGELGVAVQSRFAAVGSVVPWARSGVGAIATQAFANTQYGPRGLDLLQGGKSVQEALAILQSDDALRDRRQVGIISSTGTAATFTGADCHSWAGGKTGPDYAVQGNILAGEEVVNEMASAFEGASGNLASRLLLALAAGQAAGGDRRGMQSAALLIVRDGWGYGGQNDRYRDLRVDDHPEPITELRRILGIHEKLFPQPPLPVPAATKP